MGFAESNKEFFCAIPVDLKSDANLRLKLTVAALLTQEQKISEIKLFVDSAKNTTLGGAY